MSYDRYRVSIECLENGYKVEIPDMEMIAKKQKEAAARNKSSGSYPDCYIGDCTKSYIARNVKEAVKLVQASLEKLPDMEYDTAFEDAAKKAK